MLYNPQVHGSPEYHHEDRWRGMCMSTVFEVLLYLPGLYF